MPLPLDMTTPALCELAEQRFWIAWRPISRNGKIEKVPCDPVTGVPYSVTDPNNWLLFDELAKLITGSTFRDLFAGIVFDKSNPYCGIDLDKCYKDGAFTKPEAEDYIKTFSSYTELSPSKFGFHILIKGKRPPGYSYKEQWVEIYDEKRFFTVTGNHYDKAPDVIESRQAELEEFLETKFKKTAGSGVENTEDFPLVYDPMARAPKEKFDILMNNNSMFAMSWEHKRKDLENQTTSEYELSLMYWSMAAEWEPQEVMNLCIEHRHDKCGSPEEVKKLKDVSAKGLFKRNWKKASISVQRNYGDVSFEINLAMEMGEQACLDVFNQNTGIKVDKVVISGANPATFYFIIGEHTIDLGNSKQLMKLNEVRGQLFEFTGKAIRLDFKKEKWFKMIEMLYSIAERRDQKLLTKRYITMSYADAYLKDRGNATGEGWQETALAGMPFVKKHMADDELGKHDYLFFSLQEYRKYLWHYHTTKLPTQDCIRDLTECGFRNASLSFTVNSKKHNRSLWRIKMEDVRDGTDIPCDRATGDGEDDTPGKAGDLSDREIWEQIDPNMQPDKSGGTRDSGPGDPNS